MKKVLCLFLVFMMIVPCAYADENITYKTDKFFLRLSSDWVEAAASDTTKSYTHVTDGKYDSSKGYLMLMEMDESGVNKKNAELYEEKYLRTFASVYELTGKVELIANETITVNDKDKEISFLYIIDESIGAKYSYMAFVGGNGKMLLVMYGNESSDSPKKEFAKILESIVVR